MTAVAQARLKEASAVRKASEAVRDSGGTLAARPDDPEANLALGKFHALSRGDWDRGLAFLARGSDAELQTLAAADLASPADGQEAAELADRYAARAAAASQPAKTNLQARAWYWYHQAASRLTGLEQTKVEKKAAPLDKSLLAQRPIVLYASYGAFKSWTDVTETVRGSVVLTARGQRVIFKADTGKLGIPDPASDEHKTLAVVYRYRGGIHLSLTGDTDTVSIPAAPGDAGVRAPGKPSPGQGALLILFARFGNESTYGDSTTKTQAAVKGDPGRDSAGVAAGRSVFRPAQGLHYRLSGSWSSLPEYLRSGRHRPARKKCQAVRVAFAVARSAEVAEGKLGNWTLGTCFTQALGVARLVTKIAANSGRSIPP